MTLLDPSHEVVVTDPDIPDFEIRIPAGVQIIGWDGQPNTKVSVTAVPIDRLPLPPPSLAPGQAVMTVYMFHFFKPGGGVPTQPIPVKYPNEANLPPGTKLDLYYYDEEQYPDPNSHQWKTFGKGTVSSDARQIVSDPGVGIPKFCCGATFPLIIVPVEDNKPTPDENININDPVNVATGMFEMEKTDMVLPGPIPVVFTRYYTARRQVLVQTNRPFGPGSGHSYNHRLILHGGSSDALILIQGNDSRAPFSKNPDGTFTNGTNPSLKGAVITNQAGGARLLRFKDGTKWFFSSIGYLTRIEDRNGNALDLTRDTSGRLLKIVAAGGREIQLLYDGDRIVSLFDPLGRQIQYRYNTAGNLIDVIDPVGGSTHYTYDTDNRMVTLTDARGITYLTNEYDTNNRVVRQTNADGGVYQYRYFGPNGLALPEIPANLFFPIRTPRCPLGVVFLDPGVPAASSGDCIVRVIRLGPADYLVTQAIVVDPEGNPTSYRFSSSGYLIELTDAAGRVTQYERTQGTHLLLSTTDPAGRVTEYTYDAAGNVATIKDPAGKTTSFTYEPTFNKLATLTDPLNHQTSFTYDPKGSLLTVTDPMNKTTTMTYNAAGQPTSVTDPLNNTTTFTYDFLGNPVGVIDPLGNVTRRGYDIASRLISMTDPNGNATEYSYDLLNHVTQITDASGGQTQFTYDGNGNLLTVTAKNQTTRYTYDVMDHLETRTDPLNRVEQYSYDLNGNLTRFTDRKGQTTEHSYDPLKRRVFTQFADGSQVKSLYDLAGRLASIEDTLSGTIEFGYDNLNRLVSEITKQGKVEYLYDAIGRRTAMVVDGGAPVEYGYDDNSRLTQVKQGVQVVGLGYDDAGRRTSLSYPNGTNTSYTYDAASRLTRILHDGPTSVIEDLTYSYDAAGNRIRIGRLGPEASLPEAVQAAYDAANEQIQFNAGTPNLVYDANGSLVSQTDASGTTTYTWDARNRLAGISGPDVNASFAYDSFGRRISKIITGVRTDYQYDRNDIIAEIGGGAVGVSYLRSLRMDEPFIRQGSDMEYYHTDALGSTLDLTSPTGGVITSYVYGAFGNTTTTGASSNPLQYTNRENDGTGLYYYRSRYYSPRLQRFVSEDPLHLSRKHLSHLYSYVANNPIRFIDPFGLEKKRIELCSGSASSCFTIDLPKDTDLPYFQQHIKDEWDDPELAKRQAKEYIVKKLKESGLEAADEISDKVIENLPRGWRDFAEAVKRELTHPSDACAPAPGEDC